ncbi:ferritin family protein [Acidobacteriota bacterium]
MSIIKVLNRAILLEQKFCECYDLMSQMASESYLAKDLKKLSEEETYHANLIRSGNKILTISPDLVQEMKISYLEIDTGITKLNDLSESLKNNTINLKDAIKRIYDLEMVFEKVHMDKVAEFDDPALKDLFRALSNGDNKHRKRLEQIMNSYRG